MTPDRSGRVVPEHGTPRHLRPVHGRPRRGASRDSQSRHAALDGDRRGCEPRSLRAGSGKDSGRPWSPCRESPHREGSGRRAHLQLHPCQPPVRPHSPRPIRGVSPAACAMRWRSQSARGCATGVAAATPKMRVAPQKRSAPGTHRPSLLRRPGGTAPGPDNRRPVPAASGLACASSASHWKGAPNGD